MQKVKKRIFGSLVALLLCLLIATSSCLTTQAATSQKGKIGASVDEVLDDMGVNPGELCLILAMVEPKVVNGESVQLNVPFDEDLGYLLEPGHQYVFFVYYIWRGEHNGDDLHDVMAHCVLPQTIAAGTSGNVGLYCNNDRRDGCVSQQFYSDVDLRLTVCDDMVILGNKFFTTTDGDFVAEDFVSLANLSTATELWKTGGPERGVAISNGNELNGVITYDNTITDASSVMRESMADGLPNFNGLPIAMATIAFITAVDVPTEPEAESATEDSWPTEIPFRAIMAIIGVIIIIALIIFKDAIFRKARGKR